MAKPKVIKLQESEMDAILTMTMGYGTVLMLCEAIKDLPSIPELDTSRLVAAAELLGADMRLYLKERLPDRDWG